MFLNQMIEATSQSLRGFRRFMHYLVLIYVGQPPFIYYGRMSVSKQTNFLTLFMTGLYPKAVSVKQRPFIIFPVSLV